jgi:hypothetical protein
VRCMSARPRMYQEYKVDLVIWLTMMTNVTLWYGSARPVGSENF